MECFLRCLNVFIKTNRRIWELIILLAVRVFSRRQLRTPKLFMTGGFFLGSLHLHLILVRVLHKTPSKLADYSFAVPFIHFQISTLEIENCMFLVNEKKITL